MNPTTERSPINFLLKGMGLMFTIFRWIVFSFITMNLLNSMRASRQVCLIANLAHNTSRIAGGHINEQKEHPEELIIVVLFYFFLILWEFHAVPFVYISSPLSTCPRSIHSFLPNHLVFSPPTSFPFSTHWVPKTLGFGADLLVKINLLEVHW